MVINPTPWTKICLLEKMESYCCHTKPDAHDHIPRSRTPHAALQIHAARRARLPLIKAHGNISKLPTQTAFHWSLYPNSSLSPMFTLPFHHRLWTTSRWVNGVWAWSLNISGLLGRQCMVFTWQGIVLMEEPLEGWPDPMIFVGGWIVPVIALEVRERYIKVC